MGHRRIVRLVLASTVLAPCLAAAQAGYSQSGDGGPNPNRVLTIETFTPGMRVPVKTSVAQPLQGLIVRGYRDIVCAPRGGEASYGQLNAPGSGLLGNLDLRARLLERLAALDAVGMQRVLQAALNGDRGQQFRELFGVELPPSTGTIAVPLPQQGQENAPTWYAWTDTLSEEQQQQLNTGSEVASHVLGTTTLVCLTLPQVDAAIATAKMVYQQVIAAMDGAGPVSSPAKPQ